MASGSGFLGQISSMEEADFAEKDPSGRYIRVRHRCNFLFVDSISFGSVFEMLSYEEIDQNLSILT